MDRLKEQLKNYSDRILVDQYKYHKEEYTQEAIALFEEEIASRKLDMDKITDDLESEIRLSDLKSEDFKPLDHLFHLSDLDLVSRIFRENEIISYADNPASSTVFPTVTEADKYYTFHVFKKSYEQAHQLLEEHFEKHEGVYKLKQMSIRERLLSFNFSEFPLSETEAAQEVNVDFSPDEAATFIKYGKRFIAEGDDIEKEQERVLFYFDSIGDLIDRLETKSDESMLKGDLLALLEVLQIYCNDTDFPSFMDETIEALLGFFTGK
jgi:hypothetical protein